MSQEKAQENPPDNLKSHKSSNLNNIHPRVQKEFECDAAELLSKNMHSFTKTVIM